MVLPEVPLAEQLLVARPLRDGIRATEPLPVSRRDIGRPHGDGNESVDLGQVLVDIALPDIERLGHPARDDREHLVEVGAPGDSQTGIGGQSEDVGFARQVAHANTSTRFLPERLAT